MIGREREIALAIDLVMSGLSTDVVGGRNSGRSALLRSLRTRLEELEWTVISVRGVASLRTHPLAALHLAGIGAPSPRGNAASLPETTTELIKAVQHTQSVLLIDDWDDLDESSWGVVESVRRATGIPTVLSRLQGMRARHTPSGLIASTLEPSYVIELQPLGFDEMERVVTEYLGGHVETSTMSSVFARSGGNTGLALALVDTCRREQRLMRQADGDWVAVAELWSPGLRAVIEAHLESLSEEMRDALEMIALIGLSDIETVRKLVPWSTLELLEERTLITIVPSGEQQLVAVVPPLLAEFFRHEPVAARRIRLTETIAERLDSGENRRMLHAAEATGMNDPLEQDALFVRLLQEQAQTQVSVARAEWNQDHGPRSAARYVQALSQVKADPQHIEQVFDRTDATASSAENRARFAIMRGNWLAYVRHDVEGMQSYFQQLKPGLGDFGRLLDAAEVRILSNIRQIPDDFAARLEVADDLPRQVQAALLQSQLMVLVSLGRFTDAQRVYARIVTLDRSEESSMPRALNALALIGSGDYDHALRDMVRGLDESRGHLDLEAAYTFGTGVALCYLLAGDYRPIDAILDTFFATGDPLPFVPTVSLMLSNIAAVVAVRRGNVELGRRHIQDVEARGLPDGTFPGQSLSWATAQIQAFNGDIEAAQLTLWNAAEQLWQRGARFAAALSYLGAIELQPDRTRLDAVRAQLAEIDGRCIPAYQSYVEALIEQSPERMLEASELTQDVGLIGIALSAVRSAVGWFRDRGDAAEAERAERLETELLEKHGIHTGLDTVRFGATAISLTDREHEVASFAAGGMSNQEIATRLVLSVRTVETHMHRIMRKLDITSRQDLRKYLD